MQPSATSLLAQILNPFRKDFEKHGIFHDEQGARLKAALKVLQDNWRKLTVVSAIAIFLILVWKLFPVDRWIQAFVDWIDSSGWIGFVFFVCIYVGASVLGFPRSLFNIGAGILFGFWIGLPVLLLSGTLTHISTFTIARYLAKDWVEARLSRIPNADRVMDAVEEDGFKLVFLIRINPFVPGVLKGYGFGTTDVGFWKYLAGSFLGFLPIAIAYVYFGWIGGRAMLSAEGLPEEWNTTLLIGGMIGSLLLIGSLIWVSRKALNRRTRHA